MATHRNTAGMGSKCAGDFGAGTCSRGRTWLFDAGVTVPVTASPSAVPLPDRLVETVTPEPVFIAGSAIVYAKAHDVCFITNSVTAEMTIEPGEIRLVSA